MRTIKFAVWPTHTIDGWKWLVWYKQYTSDRSRVNIPFIPQKDYDTGKRRELDTAGSYGE
jgi:hypothetical protein